MTVTGSGISSQIGIGQEVTPGTAVTPTRFWEFTSETVAAKKKIVQGGGLRPGKTFDYGPERYTTQRDATGDVTFPVPTKGFGLLVQQMIGSYAATAVQMGATSAYQQIHTPGTFTGKAFTMQVGRPRTDGSVEPYTYPGCKVTAWELDCAQSDLLTCKMTIDAIDELTTGTTPAGGALASPSYPTGLANFNFTQGALLQGGTVSTTAGLTSISGGTAVAAVESCNITGTNPSNTTRFYLGGGTSKNEQIQNAYSVGGGQFVLEFANRTMYDLYRSDTQFALHLSFTGTVIASSNHYLLDIILPAVFIEDGASPAVAGPDIIIQTAPFSYYDDESGTNPPIQIIYQSTDTSV